MFKRYQHVEQWGNTEVQDIELGTCHVFPKLDGTNASIWVNPDTLQIHCGSRKREVTPNNDNAGFAYWVYESESIQNLLSDCPGWRLYGEWLVPHSLKTYREEAWRRFYVFDVTWANDDTKEPTYVKYETYWPILEEYGVDFVPCIATVKNGSYEQFLNILDQNTFMMQDGHRGEGIVIKNYEFWNRYGRQTWAKIVTSEFKEKHTKAMGPTEVQGKQMIEELIAQEFVTKALCEKIKAKIENERMGWSSKYIGELLGVVFYDLVREETWTFIKKHKFPTINFKTLRTFVNQQVKLQLPEVF